MVKVNGVNGRPLDRVKYTSLLNEGSQRLAELRHPLEVRCERLKHVQVVPVHERPENPIAQQHNLPCERARLRTQETHARSRFSFLVCHGTNCFI